MTKLMISPAPKMRELRDPVKMCQCLKLNELCKKCKLKSTNSWELKHCCCVRVILHKRHILKMRSLERKRAFRESYYDSKLIPFPIRAYFVRNSPAWLKVKRIVDTEGYSSSSVSSGSDSQ